MKKRIGRVVFLASMSFPLFAAPSSFAQTLSYSQALSAEGSDGYYYAASNNQDGQQFTAESVAFRNLRGSCSGTITDERIVSSSCGTEYGSYLSSSEYRACHREVQGTCMTSIEVPDGIRQDIFMGVFQGGTGAENREDAIKVAKLAQAGMLDLSFFTQLRSKSGVIDDLNHAGKLAVEAQAKQIDPELYLRVRVEAREGFDVAYVVSKLSASHELDGQCYLMNVKGPYFGELTHQQALEKCRRAPRTETASAPASALTDSAEKVLSEQPRASESTGASASIAGISAFSAR